MTTTGREYQKSKLYAFEQRVIYPLDHGFIAYDQSQLIINYVWRELGYSFPPVTRPLSKKAGLIAAHANRHWITIPEQTSTRILLHELAHTLTMKPDHLNFNNDHAGHDDRFVGAYFMLLERFMGTSQIMLMAAANEVGLQYKVFGKAAFED